MTRNYNRSGCSYDFGSFLENFSDFGSKSQYFEDVGIPYYVNEFWTSGQRQAHSLHEISYRACFKPQLPEFFIERLCPLDGSVLDPFMGRGTTLLQAALMGRHAIGNDINPLSKMLIEPRLAPPSVQDIEKRLSQIPWHSGKIEREDLLCFYHPQTLSEISALRSWFANRRVDNSFDVVDGWIQMVALNRLTGHSPGFFSGYTLPPNQAVSIASQKRINQRLGISPPYKNVASLIIKKTKSLLKDGGLLSHRGSLFLNGSADNLAQIDSATVDLVVTSPPFLDVVQYADDNWLRCWFASVEISHVPISMHRQLSDWTSMTRNVLAELARVVKPGGWIVFEVGEVRKASVKLEHSVWEAAQELPFERVCVMVNSQNFTKTSNIWGVGNGASGTNTNRMVILKRKTD